jgi:hypothetical protein
MLGTRSLLRDELAGAARPLRDLCEQYALGGCPCIPNEELEQLRRIPVAAVDWEEAMLGILGPPDAMTRREATDRYLA